jgi:hypothetical protein
MLNDFFNATITKFNLSNREYNNMKSIMIALMRIAIDEEIIVKKPMNKIYIKSKFRAIRKKSDGSKLYLNDEFDALDTHLQKENDSEYRFISLTDVSKEIIRKAREINTEGEFIFERNGERLTARAVTYWLSKSCKDAGITYKSPHYTYGRISAQQKIP